MNGLDWRGLLALCGILAAAGLLIAYQRRGKNAGEWLSYSALSLELLGLSLSLYWAANAPDGAILPIVFCVGWIGMLIGRAVLIPLVVKKSHAGDWGAVSAGIAGLMLAYAALYGSGLFHALNDAGDAAAARLEQSKPAQALDSEIEATRAKIAGLAGFADAGKAAQVENEIAAQNQAAAARAAAASQAAAAEIATARAALDSAKIAAAAHMQPDCTPKKDGRGQPYTSRAAAACETVRAAAAAVEDAKSAAAGIAVPGGAAGSDSYLSRHGEYNGLQQHLITLQNQRAALSTSGGAAIVSAWKPEDVALAEWFNTTPDQASRFKWLIATGIFDILSLIFRIVAALAGAIDAGREMLRKLAALLGAGFQPQDAAALLAGGANEFLVKENQNLRERLFRGGDAEIPAAQVLRPGEPLPALDTGGRVLSDGAAVLHDGEIVLNRQATEALDRLYPGLADMLNARKPIAAPSDKAAPKDSRAYKAAPKDKAAPIAAPVAPNVVFRDRERVAPELSGIAAPGRVGKVDCCRDCGADFVVLTYNGTRCPPHSEEAEISYRRAANRKRRKA
jgi:hypothetical protein